MKKEKTNKENQKPVKETLRRIFAEHAQFKKQIVVFVLLNMMVMTAFSVWPYFVARLIDALNAHQSWEQVLVWLGALFASVMVAVLLMRLRWTYEVLHLDCTIGDFVAETTMRHLNRLSIGQHLDKNSVVTASKVANGEAALRGIFNILVYQMVPTLVGATVACVAMTSVYPIPGMVTIAICLIACFVTVRIAIKFYKPTKRLNRFQHKKIRKSGGEFLRHIGSAMLASAEHRLVDQHMRNRAFRQWAHSGIYLPMGKSVSLMWVTGMAGRVTVIGVASWFVFKGQYEIGAIAAVMAWSQQSLNRIMDLQSLVRHLLQQWADVTTFFEIRDTKPDIETPSNAPKLPVVGGEIVFDGVFFSYPRTEENALHDVSFSVTSGQTVAIVGPSGAGKTTVLKLMQGAYAPGLGSVRIDGFELTSLDLHDLRQKVGFIEQKPCLLDQSLLNNLLLACSESRREYLLQHREVIHDVLRRVGLSHLIERLGDRVGENGDKLSGGEGQRVTIARAILQEPEMLVIDEATSAVDPANEEEVHKLIDSIAKGATKIVVAHRLSTVQDSDQILVMEQGRIVGQGTHETLLEECELYQSLASKSLLRV